MYDCRCERPGESLDLAVSLGVVRRGGQVFYLEAQTNFVKEIGDELGSVVG